MIGTIGSLVKEASDRRHWPLAFGLYAAACIGAAALLGAAFGATGRLARGLASATVGAWLPSAGDGSLGRWRLPTPWPTSG